MSYGLALFGTLVALVCWVVGVLLTLTGIGAIVGLPLIAIGFFIAGACMDPLLKSKQDTTN